MHESWRNDGRNAAAAVIKRTLSLNTDEKGGAQNGMSDDIACNFLG